MTHRVAKPITTEAAACNACAPIARYSPFRLERELPSTRLSRSGAASRRSLKIMVLAGFLSGILAATIFAQNVQLQSSLTLAWDTDSSGGVAGYNVYYGVASRN